MTGSEDIEEIFSHINKIKSEYEKMYPLEEKSDDTVEEPKDVIGSNQETIMKIDDPVSNDQLQQNSIIQKYEQKISDYNAELEEKNKKIKEMTQHIQNKNSIINEHVFEIERLRTKIFDQQPNDTFSEEKIKKLEDTLIKKNEELNIVKNKLKQKTDVIKNLEEKISKNTFNDKLEELENFKENAEKDLSIKDKKLENLEKRHKRDKKRINTKTKKIKELKEELEQLKNLQDESAVNQIPDSEDTLDEEEKKEEDTHIEGLTTEENESDEVNEEFFEQNNISDVLDEQEDLNEKHGLDLLEDTTNVESVSMDSENQDLLTLSDRMMHFQEELNSLDLVDLSTGLCDICGEEIMLEKNLSGLVVGGNVFACEKCCTDSSKEDLSEWTKSKMKKPGDVRPIGLWLTQEKNKQQSLQGSIKL